MRSCLILGSGRSGTSLAAGIVARAGYFAGAAHWQATEANPKGFFEDRTINAINERLLTPLTPRTLPWVFGQRWTRRLGWLQRWLAVVPLDATVTSTPSLDRQIAQLTAQRPFCFKDPRFCYTLPAWRPHLGDAAYLCVFRHPAVTLTSLRKEIASARYLRSLELDDEHLLAMWNAMYEHVLERHRGDGDWAFAHYDQLLSGRCLDRWQELLDTELDAGFADRSLRRSTAADRELDERTTRIYRRLCELADYADA